VRQFACVRARTLRPASMPTPGETILSPPARLTPRHAQAHGRLSVAQMPNGPPAAGTPCSPEGAQEFSRGREAPEGGLLLPPSPEGAAGFGEQADRGMLERVSSRERRERKQKCRAGLPPRQMNHPAANHANHNTDVGRGYRPAAPRAKPSGKLPRGSSPALLAFRPRAIDSLARSSWQGGCSQPRVME